MKTPNSDFEVRPCISNFKFYIGQTGHKEDNPLLDFDRLKDGSELGIEFTLSGLNRIYKNEDSNAITLAILFYERIGKVGYQLNNLWSIDLDDNDMKSSYRTFNFTITKTYSDVSNKVYDMYLNYPLIKIITLHDKIDIENLDKETVSYWMSWPQQNELLNIKIPMIPSVEDN